MRRLPVLIPEDLSSISQSDKIRECALRFLDGENAGIEAKFETWNRTRFVVLRFGGAERIFLKPVLIGGVHYDLYVSNTLSHDHEKETRGQYPNELSEIPSGYQVLPVTMVARGRLLASDELPAAANEGNDNNQVQVYWQGKERKLTAYQSTIARQKASTLILTGVPGAGKSLTLLAHLIKEVDELRQAEQLSALLVVCETEFVLRELRSGYDAWLSTQAEEIDVAVTFSTHLQAVHQILGEQPNVLENPKQDWVAYFERHKKRLALSALTAEALYQEFALHALTLHEDLSARRSFSDSEYAKIGRRHLVPNEHLPLAYKAFGEYLQSLDNSKKINLDFSLIKHQRPPQFARVVIDEAHRYSMPQLVQLSEFGEKITAVIDPTQSDNAFSNLELYLQWVRLHRCEPEIRPLFSTHRTPRSVNTLLNRLLRLLNVVQDGFLSKVGSYAQIVTEETDDTVDGSVTWVSSQAAQEQAVRLKSLGASLEFAVFILSESDREAAKARYGVQEYQVFTIDEIRGYEFDSAALFCVIPRKLSQRMNQFMREVSFEQELKTTGSTLKTISIQLQEIITCLHDFLVLASRARRHLVIDYSNLVSTAHVFLHFLQTGEQPVTEVTEAVATPAAPAPAPAPATSAPTPAASAPAPFAPKSTEVPVVSTPAQAAVIPVLEERVDPESVFAAAKKYWREGDHDRAKQLLMHRLSLSEQSALSRLEAAEVNPHPVSGSRGATASRVPRVALPVARAPKSQLTFPMALVAYKKKLATIRSQDRAHDEKMWALVEPLKDVLRLCTKLEHFKGLFRLTADEEPFASISVISLLIENGLVDQFESALKSEEEKNNFFVAFFSRLFVMYIDAENLLGLALTQSASQEAQEAKELRLVSISKVLSILNQETFIIRYHRTISAVLSQMHHREFLQTGEIKTSVFKLLFTSIKMRGDFNGPSWMNLFALMTMHAKYFADILAFTCRDLIDLVSRRDLERTMLPFIGQLPIENISTVFDHIDTDAEPDFSCFFWLVQKFPPLIHRLPRDFLFSKQSGVGFAMCRSVAGLQVLNSALNENEELCEEIVDYFQRNFEWYKLILTTAHTTARDAKKPVAFYLFVCQLITLLSSSAQYQLFRQETVQYYMQLFSADLLSSSALELSFDSYTNRSFAVLMRYAVAMIPEAFKAYLDSLYQVFGRTALEWCVEIKQANPISSGDKNFDETLAYLWLGSGENGQKIIDTVNALTTAMHGVRSAQGSVNEAEAVVVALKTTLYVVFLTLLISGGDGVPKLKEEVYAILKGERQKLHQVLSCVSIDRLGLTPAEALQCLYNKKLKDITTSSAGMWQPPRSMTLADAANVLDNGPVVNAHNGISLNLDFRNQRIDLSKYDADLLKPGDGMCVLLRLRQVKAAMMPANAAMMPANAAMMPANAAARPK